MNIHWTFRCYSLLKVKQVPYSTVQSRKSRDLVYEDTEVHENRHWVYKLQIYTFSWERVFHLLSCSSSVDDHEHSHYFSYSFSRLINNLNLVFKLYLFFDLKSYCDLIQIIKWYMRRVCVFSFSPNVLNRSEGWSRVNR